MAKHTQVNWVVADANERAALERFAEAGFQPTKIEVEDGLCRLFFKLAPEELEAWAAALPVELSAHRGVFVGDRDPREVLDKLRANLPD